MKNEDRMNWHFFFLYTFSIVVTDMHNTRDSVTIDIVMPVEIEITDTKLAGLRMHFSMMKDITMPRSLNRKGFEQMTKEVILDYMYQQAICIGLRRIFNFNYLPFKIDNITLAMRIVDATNFINKCNYDYLQCGILPWEQML